MISQVDPYNAFLYSSDVNFKHNGEICPESHGFQATNTSNRFPGRNFFVFSEEKFLLPPEGVEGEETRTSTPGGVEGEETRTSTP